MHLWPALLAALIGYLCGSVSFARIVAHFVAPGRDLRDYESPIEGSAHTYRMQAVSATTVSMQMGNKWGACHVRNEPNRSRIVPSVIA